MLDASVAFAKRAAQGKTQQTLGDLEQQQQKHLDELVSNLIKQQRTMLDNICDHLQTSDPRGTDVLQRTGLQDLLITEGLLSPLDAVEKRKKIYQEYQQTSTLAETKSVAVAIPTEKNVLIVVEAGNEKT